jgi:glycosyltransferase involved in cell wall biosynthesis
VSPDPRNPLNDVSTMNKVLEYMACAKPVVCYDLREHRYSAGEGAVYARADDVGDLAAQIVALLDDPARRAAMGSYNRERFLTQMAWEYNAGTLIEAYETLCGTPLRNA